MSQEFFSSNMSLLELNVSFTGPDRATLELTDQVISGTIFTYIAQLNYFSENNAGDYTCIATITPRSMSAFLAGTGVLSGKIQLKIGNIESK